MLNTNLESAPEYLTSIHPEIIYERGSLGSWMVVLKGGDAEIRSLLSKKYGEHFKRNWHDLKEEVAVFMSPTMAHENLIKRASDLVESLGSAMEIDVVCFLSTDIGDRKSNYYGVPDSCFFIGEKATEYKRRCEIGDSEEAIMAWAEQQPFDLVVEVEHSHYDASKKEVYRTAGVRELWELSTLHAKRQTAIVNLTDFDAPKEVGISSVLPGVTREGLLPALEFLRRIGGLSGYMEHKAKSSKTQKALMSIVGVESNELASSDGWYQDEIGKYRPEPRAKEAAEAMGYGKDVWERALADARKASFPRDAIEITMMMLVNADEALKATTTKDTRDALWFAG